MSSERTIHQIILQPGEVLRKEDRPKEVIKQPSFYKVGNGTMNKHKIQAIDFIDELLKLSKPAQTVVSWIKDGMVYDPYKSETIFIVQISPDNDAARKTLTRGFKELKEKDLVRRVKRGYYMINPYAMITNFDKQLEVWNKCKP